MPQPPEKLAQGSLRQERLHTRIELRKEIRLMSSIGKPLKERKHKAKPLHAATWPATPDQKKQSRPMIVTNPIKRMLQSHSRDAVEGFLWAAGASINGEKRSLDAAYLYSKS